MSINTKFTRSTKAQIDYLCLYMARHADFAAGEFRGSQGAASHEREWAQLKAALDEIGPAKSVHQWKTCWRDQKRKARVEGGALARAKNSTGNYVPILVLSDNAVLVLDTIGMEMASGIGPDESPVGWSGPSTSSATPAAAEASAAEEAPAAVEAPATVKAPAAAPRRPTFRRTAATRRRVTPPNNFLEAQLSSNAFMKNLVEEMKKGNRLKEEQNGLLRKIADELSEKGSRHE